MRFLNYSYMLTTTDCVLVNNDLFPVYSNVVGMVGMHTIKIIQSKSLAILSLTKRNMISTRRGCRVGF